AGVPQENSQLHSILDKTKWFQRLLELHDSIRFAGGGRSMTFAIETKPSKNRISSDMWQRPFPQTFRTILSSSASARRIFRRIGAYIPHRRSFRRSAATGFKRREAQSLQIRLQLFHSKRII